jgi:hypothetical protein
MKKTHYLFLLTMTLFFFVAGCQNEEVHLVEDNEPGATAENAEVRTFSLTASMPEGSLGTRVAFTQDGKNVSLTWEEGDQLDLLFVQGGTKVKQSLVPVSNISENGKKAGFSINLPQEIQDGTFDLYGVYGGLGLSDSNPSLALLPKTDGSATSLTSLSEGEHFVLVFSQTGLTTTSPQASVTFRHLGSPFCLTMKNVSGTTVENVGSAKLSSSITGWAYNSGAEQMYYNVTNDQLQGDSGGDNIMLYADGAIGTNDTINFWGWYPPLPDVSWPELTLTLYNKGNTLLGESSNDKPARTSPTLPGRCYHLYAVWNDAGLHFTDNSFTLPLGIEDLTIEGNLMHAAGGPGFIAVVYSKGDGKVYYNAAQTNGTWMGETDLGAGSEARVAVNPYGPYPHVVFTTADNKIAYLRHDGESWYVPAYIISNAGGACSKPDIDVDYGGYAHITYTDTKGQNGDYTDHPDIMYVNYSNGIPSEKTVIYNGYYDGWEQSYKIGHYYNKGSRITVDAAGQYFIMTHHQDYYRSVYSGTDNTYQVLLKSGNASGTLRETYNYDREDIFDIGFDGANVVAFYKTGNVITTSELTVSDATIGFANPQTVTTALLNTYAYPATLMALPGGVRALTGISSTAKLFVKYGTEADELLDETVKSSTVAVAVQCVGDTYVVWTGSGDGLIRFAKRE